jgi:hypothetical protein
MKKITIGGESLTATDEQLKKIKEILGVKKGRVEIGCRYYCVTDHGYVDFLKEMGDPVDNYCYLTGNYFLTKEEAEKHLEYTKALGRVTRRIEELNGGEKGKWMIYFSFLNRFTFAEFQGEIAFKLPYCATGDIAQQIIKECESDLKMIFGV